MNTPSAITKPGSSNQEFRLPSSACKILLRASLALCMAVAMACVVQADTGVPAFTATQTLTVGDVAYTWQSPAIEELDPNDESITVHTDTYMNGEETLTLTGRLGNPQPILATVNGSFSGIWTESGFHDGGFFDTNGGPVVNGYTWTEGGNTMEVKPDWSLGFLSGRHTYTSADFASSITTSVDANGNGTFNGSNGETGVVYGGNPYFDQPSAQANTYGLEQYSLFGAAYYFTPGSLTYSLFQNPDMSTVIFATENYHTYDASGTMSVSSLGVAVDGPYAGTFSGHDPVVGIFSGTFAATGEFAFDAGRISASFAVPNLWLNSTAITWVEGRILNADGDVRDTYTGTDMDGNTVTLTITANVIAPVTRSVKVQVRDSATQELLDEGNGTLENGTNGDYFSVPGWYVGEAESNRTVPHFMSEALRFFVNGSIYSFHAGIDDGSRSIDVYKNDSLGKVTLVGPSSGTSATVYATFAGAKWKGTFGVVEANAFSVNGCTITAWPNPDAFWVGPTFYTRTPANPDVYVAGDYFLTVSMVEEVFHVSGTDASCSFEGNFTAARGAFMCSGDSAGTMVRLLACPANADGSLQIGSFVRPQGVPPVISIHGELWPCIGIALDTPGSTAPTAHYANVASAHTRSLSILPDGSVTHTGVTSTEPMVLTTVTGRYSTVTHLFQSDYGQLPMPIYGADPECNCARWQWLTPPGWRPNTVLVAGAAWGYAGKDASGADIYQGCYTDQQISFAGDGRDGYSHVTLTDPIHTTGGGVSTFAGTFYNNLFTMATAGSPTVLSGDGAGTQITAGLSLSTTGADLDILGNVFSLGSLHGKPNVVGLSLEFADDDTTARLYSTLSRPQSEWLWSRSDASPTPRAILMMKLDSGNALSLFDPAAPAIAPIVLNPAGRSRFDKPIRIAPQGDLDMGDFKNGPGEPLPPVAP